MKARIWQVFFGVLWVSLGAVAQAAQLKQIRVSAQPNKTRIVLDLDRALSHNLFTLKNPNRVVVDLASARVEPSISVPGGAGLLKNIRYATKASGDVRVVFDVSRAVQPRSFLLPPQGDRSHRLVIDLLPSGSTQLATTKTAPQKRDIVIAIDAGHGGKDPGATGPGGLLEKDVVLKIAKHLGHLIDQQPGMRAFLIRDDDTFISLRQRAAIARKQSADLFVSIHADAFRDFRARGSSVYVLSKSGATSEAARWLAESENRSDLRGGVKLDDKDDMLASVLLDLSQNATNSSSMQAAKSVLQEIGTVNRLHSRSVKQAGFIVLMSPDIPSIFVEAAFISNPGEARKLRDPGHQEAMARAIMTGIHKYFRANTPPDTQLTALKMPAKPKPVQHRIASGDTLSEIAEKYNVSLRRLRQANGLKSDRIRIGQTLQIPAAI